MTQNTTKNDKREQCDTKHNALKIYLTRKNLLRRTLFLQPTRQRVSGGYDIRLSYPQIAPRKSPRDSGYAPLFTGGERENRLSNMDILWGKTTNW